MRTSKVLSLLLICTWLLAACRPAIAPAPATITQTVPAATRQAATTTPFSTATLEPTLTLTGTVHTPIPATQAGANTLASGPDAPASAYRLKSWTEADMEAAIQEADEMADRAWEAWSENDLQMPGEFPYQEYDYRDYKSTLGQEAERKGFQLDPEYDMPWFLALHEIDQDFVPPTENIRSLLEVAFNTGEISTDPDLLNQWLNKKGGRLESIHATNNLFRDGKPAKVLHLGYTYLNAIFILSGDQPGAYHLQVYPDFWGIPYGERVMVNPGKTISIIDSNANGQPEIRIEKTDTSSGWPKWQESRLQLLEWDVDKKRFVDLARFIPLEVEKIQMGEPLGWSFNSTSGSQPQSITGGIAYDPLMPGCMTYTHQVTYAWNGEVFLPASESWSPPPQAARRNEDGNLVPVTNSVTDTEKCRFFWAYRTGARNDLAVTLLEAYVKHPPKWLEESFGPGAQDYFRMTLGIWYAERHQPDLAGASLSAVRDHPMDPKFKIAGKLAQEFLDGSQVSLFTACASVNRMQVSEWRNIKPSDLNFSAAILSAWGFRNPDWFHEWDYDGYQTPLCDDRAAFIETVSSLSPKNLQDFKDSLARLQAVTTDVSEIDLDGDSRPDWLLGICQISLVDPDCRWSLWAFLRGERGITPILIQERRVYFVQNQSLNLVSMPSGTISNRLYFIQAESSLGVIKVEPKLALNPKVQDDWFYNQSIRSSTPSSSSKDVSVIFNKFSVDHFVFNPVDGNLTIFSTPPSLNYDNIQIYHWDEQAEEIRFVRDIPFEPKATFLRIENMLFGQRNPTGAIVLLEQVLSNPIIDDQPNANKPLIPRYRPYLQYLLGLSYELAGQPEKAVQAYWRLWDEFPKNPYTLAVIRKLVKR